MPNPKLPLSVVVFTLSLAGCRALGPTTPTDIPPATAGSPALAYSAPTIPAQASSAATSRGDTQSILDRLGGYPCVDSDFTCVSLEVPLDHFAPANSSTIDVVFGVLPASGDRKGMFVTVVGGPGGSGLAVADSYTSALDPAITEAFDVVFFDQRGIAASGGLQCVTAAAAFYRADWDAATPAGEAALVDTAESFAQDCVAEIGSRDLLPYLGTEQAVEDLELFRQTMQDERFWLYGESYGTQFAQTYAATHPEQLAGLILDGPVDLTLSGIEYLEEQAAAFNNVLLMTLDACANDPACAADLGGDPVGAYDDLAARLAQGLLNFDFPLPSGGFAERTLSFADLETSAASYLYSETARMIFLRALAAAESRGDLVPLARVLYDSLYLYPDTLEPVLDPTFSDAIYYAVECNDYDYGPAEGFLRAGDPIEVALPRFASIFYGDLPCAFWPEDGFDPGRPVPLTAEGIPTLVMVGTADPATPIGNALRIVEPLADGYLVVEEGGPHVIFGWGNSCVDDLVTAFLVTDTVPDDRETSCEGVVIDDYLPLPPATVSGFADVLDAMISVDDEIYYLPEYYYWDLVTPTSVGCPFGGTLGFDPSEVGEQLTFAACAFTGGFLLTGSGVYDYDAERFTLDVSMSGAAQGSLVYTREGDGSVRVIGEYAGEAVDLSG
jgi:pimeloyl-ACP methyl ester carboxylesterase